MDMLGIPNDGGGGGVSTGTTIMACCFPGGVVLGADGRVSIGNYIMNRASNKIAQLSDNVFLCRSGSAPDTQLIADYVHHFVYQLAMETGEEPSVNTISKLVAQVNYNNKDNLVGAMVVAGFDAQKGGQIFGCPIGGTRVSETWTIDGSGSTFLWGYCGDTYRDDFTEAEAENFVKECLALAMARDGSSGGCVRLITCTATGAKHTYVAGDQVPLYDEELKPPSHDARVAML